METSTTALLPRLITTSRREPESWGPPWSETVMEKCTSSTLGMGSMRTTCWEEEWLMSVKEIVYTSNRDSLDGAKSVQRGVTSKEGICG